MLILVTQEWAGLGIALLAKSQGSEVVAAYQYDEKKQEDLDEIEKIGDGLIEKLPLEEATRKLLGRKHLWVFDGNIFPIVADRLRKFGEDVIGTSRLAAKMEADRDYAVGVAESLGLRPPKTVKFSDYGAADAFLRGNPSKAYAYKPFKGDPTSTYVPQQGQDSAEANEDLREYLASISGPKAHSFILQEVVEGVEVAFDLWLRNGEPVAAFCDLEAKRKLTGELGELVGCAGGYVFKVPLEAKGVQETVGKYLAWEELKGYTGSVDVNISFVEGKPLFFENCFRFAFNAYPSMLHVLSRDTVEQTLREWVTGRGTMEGLFRDEFAGSLTLMSDIIKSGNPISIPDEFRNDVDVYRAFSDEGHLRAVEGWPEICCAVAPGRTVEQAGSNCLSIAEKVSFLGKGYRVDLAHSDLPTLPLSRYRWLQTHGKLKE